MNFLCFKTVMSRLNAAINYKEKEVEKMTNKRLGEFLGISATNIGSMKTREAIPFKKIIDFCNTNSIDLNYIFKDDLSEQEVVK